MNTVIPTYNISCSTLALLPAREIDYDMIVIKDNETKYVRQPSLNLIKRPPAKAGEFRHKCRQLKSFFQAEALL